MMVDQTHPTPATLSFPLEPYNTDGYHFKQPVRSRIILWARHLGDDVLGAPGTPIHAIGDGAVVWSEMRLGSEEKRNWGGIVIIGHTNKVSGESFYSLYGHLKDLTVHQGDVVTIGQEIGRIAPGHTPENGWWKIPHLHFGIYTGPWMNTVLPGYKRPFERRTKVAWWQDPKPFIEGYIKE